MADLAAIRNGLAANLAPLADTFQVSPYMLANPTPPTIHIYPATIDYDLTMVHGYDKWVLTVQAVAGEVSDIGAQQLLDTLLTGPHSVNALLYSEPTGGTIQTSGVIDDLSVTGWTGYRLYVRENGGPVVGAEWNVEILARAS